MAYAIQAVRLYCQRNIIKDTFRLSYLSKCFSSLEFKMSLPTVEPLKRRFVSPSGNYVTTFFFCFRKHCFYFFKYIVTSCFLVQCEFTPFSTFYLIIKIKYIYRKSCWINFISQESFWCKFFNNDILSNKETRELVKKKLLLILYNNFIFIKINVFFYIMIILFSRF